MPLHKLRIGSRIRAKVDHYPAKAGAIGTVRYLRPGLLYAVVEWQRPEDNLSPEPLTELSHRDLAYFDVL